MKPDLPKFKELARQGNLVPVFLEELSDMETPVSVFHRFADDEYAFLLESVEGGRTWGRYSFIGVSPREIFTVENGKNYLETPAGKKEFQSEHEGFAALRDLMKDLKPVQVDDLPRFAGGAVGYTSYETVKEFEPKLPDPHGEEQVPMACFMVCDTMIVFDNVRHTMKLVAWARPNEAASVEDAYRNACEKVRMLQQRLHQPVLSNEAMRRPESYGTPGTYDSNMTKEQYCDIVKKAREHIIKGDIIQVVLSQRFEGELPAHPMTIYRALRLINPSPYTFFLKMGKRMLVGASPEVMVRLTGGQAVVRPIAGTRKRGATEQEDRALADDLLKDPKERAEHLMLVDLGRNDLGRVAVPGTVKVPDFMVIEKYSHVQHMVSSVTAELKPDMDAFDLVGAVFPAGTLSGAPKFRAMEIINDLEPCRRGPYGGAVGYIGFDGNMDLAITIRTLEINGNKVAVQAGAGIVYDSIPENEYEECRQKARAVVKSLELAANGLDLDREGES